MSVKIKAHINSHDGMLRIKAKTKFYLDPKSGALYATGRLAKSFYITEDGALAIKPLKNECK